MSQCERPKRAHADSVDDNIMHLHVVSTCELCLDVSLTLQTMASRGGDSAGFKNKSKLSLSLRENYPTSHLTCHLSKQFCN